MKLGSIGYTSTHYFTIPNFGFLKLGIAHSEWDGVEWPPVLVGSWDGDGGESHFFDRQQNLGHLSTEAW